MDVAQSLGHALSVGNLAALPLALIGGLITGINPCCLALYPAAATVCCSVGQQTRRAPLGRALAFVLGIAVAIAVLGGAAAYIGRIVSVGTPAKYGIAVIPIVMGIFQLGWLPISQWTTRSFTASAGGAFGTGALLSVIIGPCGTPVLASVLSFASYSQSFAYGGLLLFVYGVGSAVPLMFFGTAAGGLLNALERSGWRPWLDAFLGGSLVLLGFYLLWQV